MIANGTSFLSPFLLSWPQFVQSNALNYLETKIRIGFSFVGLPFTQRVSPNRPLSPQNTRILSRFVCIAHLQNNRQRFLTANEKRVAHVRHRLFLYLRYVTRFPASNLDKSRWKSRGIVVAYILEKCIAVM